MASTDDVSLPTYPLPQGALLEDLLSEAFYEHKYPDKLSIPEGFRYSAHADSPPYLRLGNMLMSGRPTEFLAVGTDGWKVTVRNQERMEELTLLMKLKPELRGMICFEHAFTLVCKAAWGIGRYEVQCGTSVWMAYSWFDYEETSAE